MPKCKKCGTDFSEFEENCPYCGTVATADTITDIMDKPISGSGKSKKGKKDKKPLFSRVRREEKHKADCECKKCGASLHDGEICPKCGFSPGVESITSVMKKSKGE